MIDRLQLIKKTVAIAKALPNATIEYNLEELPESSFITKDNFLGVEAIYNPKRQIDTLNVVRKFQ